MEGGFEGGGSGHDLNNWRLFMTDSKENKIKEVKGGDWVKAYQIGAGVDLKDGSKTKDDIRGQEGQQLKLKKQKHKDKEGTIGIRSCYSTPNEEFLVQEVVVPIAGNLTENKTVKNSSEEHSCRFKRFNHMACRSNKELENLCGTKRQAETDPTLRFTTRSVIFTYGHTDGQAVGKLILPTTWPSVIRRGRKMRR
ncbi:hypothetical protein PIB30_038164 [Stylosanthes scabra]|uniref:Uncharacterized protein n=1 Tax=Stylosanthes scabra TaxID=79078 RepID=A0ABU6XDK7_9FABA|nr:hypothetical protein [Stylosanthes scabra]